MKPESDIKTKIKMLGRQKMHKRTWGKLERGLATACNAAATKTKMSATKFGILHSLINA